MERDSRPAATRGGGESMIVVLGGGAAGMIAAYTAAVAGAEVLLVEKKARLGTKNPDQRRRQVQRGARGTDGRCSGKVQGE